MDELVGAIKVLGVVVLLGDLVIVIAVVVLLFSMKKRGR